VGSGETVAEGRASLGPVGRINATARDRDTTAGSCVGGHREDVGLEFLMAPPTAKPDGPVHGG
jgi:hypothetical protein